MITTLTVFFQFAVIEDDTITCHTLVLNMSLRHKLQYSYKNTMFKIAHNCSIHNCNIFLQ